MTGAGRLRPALRRRTLPDTPRRVPPALAVATLATVLAGPHRPVTAATLPVAADPMNGVPVDIAGLEPGRPAPIVVARATRDTAVPGDDQRVATRDADGAESGDDAAAIIVWLFDRFCLPHIGDVAAVRHAAAAASLAPVPAAEAEPVLARPGRAYRGARAPARPGLDQRRPAEPPLLLSLDDGMCGVIGRGADGAAVLGAFAGAMRDRRITARPLGAAPPGTPQAYRLDGASVHAVLMLMVTPDGGTSLLAASSRAGRT